jgi:glucose-1-phosphate adenylyltransferase
VYFGGKFRIIDFALSNCLNSGIRRIGVITQYKSAQPAAPPAARLGLPEERDERVRRPAAGAAARHEESWYRGTADAVYQNQDILASYRADYVVVLAGDHIYKMNYALMLADHVARAPTCTVGCIEVPRMEATGLRRDAPSTSTTASRLRREAGRPAGDARQARPGAGQHGHLHLQRPLPVRRARARHGRPDSSHDFGKDIIPRRGEARQGRPRTAST